MYLWTDFEGATIDSAFALTKLLQTEGRSAFFSTVNASGEPVLIRIIECHFDEDEILARWRGVQALGHPSFLRIDRFGQFLVEGDDHITSVYAVFERVEANLGEVLKRGRLSAPDAAQIGLSVASALESLHANGFVHEHIEAGNIYAVGNTVKLRSDCIREIPEGDEGIDARRRDVHALAVLLTEVLLGASGDASAHRLPSLPAPFNEIVQNGMNGSWGIAEIKAALGVRDLPKAAPKKIAQSDLRGRDAKPEPMPAQSLPPASNSATHDMLSGQKPVPMELPVIFGVSEHEFRSWVTAGAVLLGVVLVGWIFLHFWFGHGSGASAQRVPNQPAATSTIAQDPSPVASSSLAPPAPGAGSQLKGSPSGVEWRVVAFTYNRHDQAKKKAWSLAQQDPALSPAVFSPSGRAPWLVTIGGALDRDAAYALASNARSLGLPRDTYAQNYKVR
jgi:hypothetical protein